MMISIDMITGILYRHLLKPIFFHMDPEEVHDRMTRLGFWLGKRAMTRKLVASFFSFSHPALSQDIFDIHFPNPIGLAAGFDKNAQLTDILPSVGFGFAEVGSITGEPCAGNAKPRLWRLPKSRSLVVYYGLKNDGAEIISQRLKEKKFTIPIGISIAKSNSAATVQTETGIADYVKTYRLCAGIGSYVTINISCPNAYGGEPFTNPEKLDQLLTMIDHEATRKPIFLKISPDLTEQHVLNIMEVTREHTVHGFICSNLTKNRNNSQILDNKVPEKGGLSGKVVEELTNQLIRVVYKKTNGKYVIIGCGGIFTAEDAYKKIRLGASLLQIITGMIYQGPQAIGEINAGLVKLLERDGFSSLKEAVGIDA
jgi:dihydroorotate dehydrogenase